MGNSPPSGRTLAIGDIHGCIHALETVLSVVRPQPADTVICLGDFIDYGRDSASVIDRLLTLREECHLVCLLGNHEEMLLEALEQEAVRESWINCGGWETICSYRFAGDITDIPEEHIDFIRQCQPYYETATHIFTHANYEPNLPFAEQTSTSLRWTLLEEPYPARHQSGKTVVVGHTEQRDGEVLDLDWVVCIDTYCRGYGWLTMYDVDTKEATQASRWGVLRQGETTDSLRKARSILHPEANG